MRASAGLDADDLVFDENTFKSLADMFRILCGHDVVGDDEDLLAQFKKTGGDGLDEGRFSGADRTADTYSAGRHCCFV